jgi:hypothetical protein
LDYLLSHQHLVLAVIDEVIELGGDAIAIALVECSGTDIE